MDAPETEKHAWRVAAGRLNRSKRGPLSAECIERLRQAALRIRPWEHATGPTSPQGKAQSVINGKRRQLGPRSVREVRSELAQVRALIGAMREARRGLA
jgi:hypothetical protein